MEQEPMEFGAMEIFDTNANDSKINRLIEADKQIVLTDDSMMCDSDSSDTKYQVCVLFFTII